MGSPTVEASRLDRIRIDVQGNVVEISWDERRWLLGKIAVVHGYESIVAQFHAVVAANRPVELDFDECARLRAPLEFWASELTDGLARLLAALVDAAPHAAVW